MKQSFTISALCFLFLFSCKKEQETRHQTYLATVMATLKDSMTLADYQALDFDRAVFSSVDSIQLFFLRVPFRHKALANDFVIVETTREGKIKQGRIIQLEGQVIEVGRGEEKRQTFEGRITIAALNGKPLVMSAIRNGFVEAFHNRSRTRTSLVQPDNVLPEVIITYTKTTEYTYSYSTWYSLQSFAEMYDGSSGGYYVSADGGGGYGYNGYDGYYGGGGGGSVYTDPVIHVDLENQDTKEGIDIQKYVNCFNSIPDEGAYCSMEISTDIPVDSNPDAFYNFSTGSPGHVFITITKKNGTQHVSQNIGFYPKSGYKAMTYAPTASKLVDNARHEFNASIYMNITPEQLSTVLVRMQQLSNINYDVDSYNCADWALDVFNSVRTTKLEVPLYGIPDSPMTQASRTPQGLYRQLEKMTNSGHPEKANITIGIIKGYAGGSTGPCN